MPDFSFLPGAAPDDPQSYKSMMLRQQLALALAGRGSRGYPKNIGEGLTALGEGIGDRMAQDRAMQTLAAYEKYQRANPVPTTADLLKPPATTPPPITRPVVRPPPVAATSLPPGVDTFDSRFGGFPSGRTLATAPTGAATDAGTDTTETGTSTAYAPEDVSPGRYAIVTALNTAQGVPSPNPTDTGAEALPAIPATETGGPSPDAALLAARQQAIGGIESGGRNDPYQTVGVPTKYGPALGRYGIVQANVGPWSKDALGQELTPQEFLANPKAQDDIFNHRMGLYADKYGEENAARAWFGGPGNIQNTNATDAFGRLNVGTYGQDYMRRMQGAQRGAPTSALTSPDTMSDAPPVGMPNATMAFAAGKPAEAADNPPIPTDIQPAPTQVAQASTRVADPDPNTTIPPQINLITPPVILPGQNEPVLPPRAPFNAAEIEGQRRLNLGQRLGDPMLIDQGKTLIEQGGQIRKNIDDDNLKQYQLRMETYHARALAQEAAERTAREAGQRIISKYYAPTAGGSPTPGGVINAGADPTLNTPQSPQRTGMPDLKKPPNVSADAWQQQVAPMASQAVEAVRTAVPQFNQVIKTLQFARNHPGRDYAAGLTGPAAAGVYGTPAYDYAQVLKQINGENFLAAYPTLRGGGAISNVEGEKAQQARLAFTTASSKEARDRALNDFENIVRRDLETAQRRVNAPVTAWQHSPNDPYAPDINSVGERKGKPPGKLYQYIGGNPAVDSSWKDAN